MKYFKYFLVVGFLITASRAENRLVVNDTTVSSGDTVWVTIDMENDDEVVSFQFDLELPESLIYSGVSELSDRAVDHELYVSIIDGVLRVMALSSTLEAFTDNAGTLVILGFTSSLEHGIFDVSLINPILGNYNSENILTGYVNGTITIVQIDYSGPIWYISNTGSDSNYGYEESPFATIQHGINLSANGDTVIALPGLYYENVDYSGKNIVVGSLLLTSGDTTHINQTIIDGGGLVSTVSFINVESD